MTATSAPVQRISINDIVAAVDNSPKPLRPAEVAQAMFELGSLAEVSKETIAKVGTYLANEVSKGPKTKPIRLVKIDTGVYWTPQRLNKVSGQGSLSARPISAPKAAPTAGPAVSVPANGQGIEIRLTCGTCIFISIDGMDCTNGQSRRIYVHPTQPACAEQCPRLPNTI